MKKSPSEENAGSKSGRGFPGFTPSWVNHFTGWVGRMPGMSWLYYLGLWLILVIAPSAVQWIEGAASPGTFYPIEIFIAAVIAFFLMLMHFLDRRPVPRLQLWDRH